MAKKLPKGMSEYLAEIGRKGGQATGHKGIAAMPLEQQQAIRAKAVAARKKQAKKKKG